MDSKSDSPDNTGSYSANAKILLFGEHAAVYGHPALGVGIDMKLSMKVSESATPSHTGMNNKETAAFKSVLKRAGKLFPGLDVSGIQADIQSTIPVGSGLGSSAALCAVMAQYVYSQCLEQNIDSSFLLPKSQLSSEWHNKEIENYSKDIIANTLEREFHGSPSGIDTALARDGRLSAFFPRSRQLPDRLYITEQREPLYIVFAALPREGNTKTLVGEIQKGMLENNPRVETAIEALGECAHSAIDILRNKVQKPNSLADGLGILADTAHVQLSNLNLSSPDLDHILEKGKTIAASGGKLSGAGGVGAFYLFCKSQQAAKEVEEQLTAYCADANISLSQAFRTAQIL